jgi:hypothetical protein
LKVFVSFCGIVFSSRIELLPDKGASIQKELRDLKLEIFKVETQLRQAQTQVGPPSMTKIPSASNLPGQKHAVLLNELPGYYFQDLVTLTFNCYIAT